MSFGSKGKGISLNVVSSKKHTGFGSGMLDLSNLSSIVIEGDQANIDIAAIHGKSRVERRIRFSTNKEDVPNGTKCWIVWVNVGRTEAGTFYSGVTACELLVDFEERKGWKILADHVNKMDAALKGKYILEGLNDTERTALRTCLQEHNMEWWNQSPVELQEALA